MITFTFNYIRFLFNIKYEFIKNLSFFLEIIIKMICSSNSIKNMLLVIDIKNVIGH